MRWWWMEMLLEGEESLLRCSRFGDKRNLSICDWAVEVPSVALSDSVRCCKLQLLTGKASCGNA